MSWRDWAERTRTQIESEGRTRTIRDLDAFGPVARVVANGRDVVSFASNDYLGLSTHPAVVDAAHRALDRWGTGSGAARLIVGSRPIHSELEAAIAEWKATERALLFPTGFSANLGVLSALGTEDALICSDELNHASIVDGCRASKGRVAVYRHKDVADVERLLRGAGRAIVVTDSVFSMDGDVAPVDDLAEVCARHGALLVLDEAHAVLGPAPDLAGVEALRVGTLSKFLGSFGGFVAGAADLIEVLKNRARAFIFTTAGSPADAAAARAALAVLGSSEGASLVARLRSVIDRIAPGHPSPIVPLVIGYERDAIETSDRLLDLGVLVPAIRPPSVPNGTSRLRVTLSAAHSDEQVDLLLAALDRVGVVAHA